MDRFELLIRDIKNLIKFNEKCISATIEELADKSLQKEIRILDISKKGTLELQNKFLQEILDDYKEEFEGETI